MAKLFYTLEEAAQKLAISPDAVKQMAASGKLQQFRDRDKLMYKCEQVDALQPTTPSIADDSAGPIPLADSGDTDKIDIKADSTAPPPGRKQDPRQATGISVFDADEIEPADPAAQTQVTPPVGENEELAIESVGSGSGLLDLTRESDDTSLGAELLDEIYPGGTAAGTVSDTKIEPIVSGDSGMASQIGASSGLDNLQEAQPGAGPAMVTVEAEAPDPGGDGLGLGLLAASTVALICLLIVGVGGISGTTSALQTMMADSLYAYAGGLLGLGVVLGVVGYFIGKAVGS